MSHPNRPSRPAGRSRRSRRLLLLLSAVLVAGLVAPEAPPAESLVQTPLAAGASAAGPSAALAATAERPAITLRPPAPPRAGRTRRLVRPQAVRRSVTPTERRTARVRADAGTDDGGLCSGPGWRERRGRAAFASLRSDAANAPGATLEFQPGRSGYLGLTYLSQRRVVLFVRSCSAESAVLLRHVLAHELGHAFDGAFMSGAERADWMRARGIASGTSWFGCGSCTDFATPAGDFAEVYAQWARGGGSFRSRMAGRPGPAELSALARTFFHA